jgi:hypothetical protein
MTLKHLQRASGKNLIENKNAEICFSCVQDHKLAKIVLKLFMSVNHIKYILPGTKVKTQHEGS